MMAIWTLGIWAMLSPSQTVEQALAKLQCYEVAFKQETASDFFDATVSSGTLTICRPGRMRMEYREGERRVLIWDGETCFEYDWLADTVSTQPQEEVRGEPLVRLLLYEGDVSEHFEVRQIEQISTPTYELTPKQDEGYKVVLVLNKDELPQRLEVHSNDGEATYFNFSNYQMLETAPEAKFQIPKR